jgi:hypothetical protein
VETTTAASVTTATTSASRAANGIPRAGSGARLPTERATTGRRGAGGSWRGLPEEGERRRTWLGRSRREDIVGHCRTARPGSRDRPRTVRSGVRWGPRAGGGRAGEEAGQ